MQRAGRSLFAKIDAEPALSVSVPMNLGMLYRLTEFVGGGAFIVGRQGAFANAKANAVYWVHNSRIVGVPGSSQANA
jgi:hypothetical protein